MKGPGDRRTSPPDRDRSTDRLLPPGYLVALLVMAVVPVAVPVIALQPSAPPAARPAPSSLAQDTLATPTATASVSLASPSTPSSSAGPTGAGTAPGTGLGRDRALPAADLGIVSISWTPARPRRGQLVLFTATVRNGSATAAPATPGVVFSVERNEVSWSRLDARPLAAGEERAYTADGGPLGYRFWFATAGRHTLRAAVDDRGGAARSGESDALEVDLPVS